MEETTIGSGKKDEGDEERTVSDLRREVINAYLSCLKQRGLNFVPGMETFEKTSSDQKVSMVQFEKLC